MSLICPLIHKISDLRNSEALQIDRVCSILEEPRTHGEVLIPKLKRLRRNVYIMQSYNVRRRLEKFLSPAVLSTSLALTAPEMGQFACPEF